MAKPRANDWIESRALFERPARELLIFKARPDDDECAWEFPGGRNHSNESPESALRRVLREQFGVEIALLQGQPPFIHNFGTHSITFRYYICSVARGNLAPAHGELRWVCLPQLRDYHFDGPTQQVVDWLLHPGAQ